MQWFQRVHTVCLTCTSVLVLWTRKHFPLCRFVLQGSVYCKLKVALKTSIYVSLSSLPILCCIVCVASIVFVHPVSSSVQYSNIWYRMVWFFVLKPQSHHPLCACYLVTSDSFQFLHQRLKSRQQNTWKPHIYITERQKENAELCWTWTTKNLCWFFGDKKHSLFMWIWNRCPFLAWCSLDFLPGKAQKRHDYCAQVNH